MSVNIEARWNPNLGKRVHRIKIDGTSRSMILNDEEMNQIQQYVKETKINERTEVQ